jgi:hypothetical protein
MNKPDILGIARQQLSDAISSFQTPTCTPLKISPWVAATRDHRGWRLRTVPPRAATGYLANKGALRKSAMWLDVCALSEKLKKIPAGKIARAKK